MAGGACDEEAGNKKGPDPKTGAFSFYRDYSVRITVTIWVDELPLLSVTVNWNR